MVNKLHGAAAPGAAAPDAATKDEARMLGGGASFEVGRESRGSGVNSGGSGGFSQTPPTDADLPELLALQAAAARDGWQLSRIVAEGAPVYLLARLRFSEVFHELDGLRAFLAARGVKP